MAKATGCLFAATDPMLELSMKFVFFILFFFMWKTKLNSNVVNETDRKYFDFIRRWLELVFPPIERIALNVEWKLNLRSNGSTRFVRIRTTRSN